MASIASVNLLQDGVRGVWIRDKTGGVANGKFFKLGGVNAIDSTRNVNERELLGNNVTYRKDSKFQDLELSMSLWSARPDLMCYFLGGTFTSVGDRSVFKEDANSQPKQFEMFVESDAVGENGEDAAIGEYFPICNAANFQNAKASGDYTSFEVTVTATADSGGSPREFIYDNAKLPFDITTDTTGATLSSVAPVDASTLAATDTDIVMTFSANMDATTPSSMIEIYQSSDGVEVTAFTAVTSTTDITLSPTSTWPVSETIIVCVKPGLTADDDVKIGKGFTLTFTVPAS